MCVISEKVYHHSDGRREIRSYTHYCHNSSGNSPCQYVERKSAGTARISEVRPSSSSSRPTSIEVIRTGSDGKQRRYQEVRRRSSKRTSGSSSKNRPIDTSNSPSSSKHRKARPTAPSPPPAMSNDASVRQQYEDVNRVLAPDGTAVYNRPPSLEMPRVDGSNERLPSVRRSSISSISAEVDASTAPRRSAMRSSRPSNVIHDTSASVTGTSSSFGTSAPGLSNLPRFSHSRQDSANDIPIFRDSKGKQPVRVDSTADEEEMYYRGRQDEEERQASIERERLNASDRRYRQSVDDEQVLKKRTRLAESARRQQQALDDEQAEKERIRLFASSQRQQRAQEEDQAEKERSRLEASRRRHKQAQDEEQARILREQDAAREARQRVRATREAEAAARKHAQDLEQQQQRRAAAGEARRERHRRQAASALERPEIDDVTQRMMDLEFDRLAREKEEDDALRRAEEEAQCQAQFPGARRPISARQYTPSRSSYVSSSMTYPPGVAVHDYDPPSSAGPSSLREKGEAVIRREQMRQQQRDKESIDAAMEEMDKRMRAGFGRSESVREAERKRERDRRYEGRQFYR